MTHLGILSLDTAFPRIPGDAGNPASYPFAAQVGVVAGAEASRIVSDQPPPPALTAAFVARAQRFEAEGAGALVSTCGFLIHVQSEVAAAVRIPVMLSPLSLFPLVQRVRPGRVGILTASAAALGPRALASAGIEEAEIAGLDHHAAFRETFLGPKSGQAQQFSREAVEALVLQEARALAARARLSALIFECGNLPPYADPVRAELGLPVFTILDAAAWMMAA